MSARTSLFGMTENDFTMVDLFKDRTYLLNLIIIALSWCASTVCFYIIGFYIKYIPGNVYSNIIIISIADALSSLGAGIVATRIGAKKTLFISFSLAAIAGTGLIFSTETFSIMFFVLITRYGINSAFTLCYIITADYFPSIVSSQVFGLCNVFSRFSTIMSPLIAEIDPPVPMIIYCLICMVSMVVSLFLTKNEEIEDAMNDLDDSLSFRSQFKSSFKAGAVNEDGSSEDSNNQNEMFLDG
jgi:Na+/melibiose symporter-like transporter